MTQVISQGETLPCVMVPTERRVCRKSKDVSKDVSKDLEGCLERCLECRRVSNVEGSRRMSRRISKDVSKDGYVVFQAYYSPLLVLVCRSVYQDPPGRLKTSLSCRSFILSVDRAQPISGRPCLRGTWPTNQRSPLAQTPLFSERSDLSFALRKYLLN